MATPRHRPAEAVRKEPPEPAERHTTTTVLAGASPFVAVPQRERGLLELVMTPVPEVVPKARRFVIGVVNRWGLGEIGGTAALLTSELVSNAVRHGSPTAERSACGNGQRILLTVRRMRLYGGLFIEVWDPASKGLRPQLRVAAPHEEFGRGLQLIRTLSRAWGHYPPAHGGRTVWCELALPGE
ncbi:ATP-binding protein [Streptomyces sp. NPDC048506]|uniref:ATP-binding protein n=1 Tax=Streptomyces sp. NPDC048506 TaxID=3155028 RepID=UPI003436AF6E